MDFSQKEIRDWVQLTFLIVGGTIALRTYINGQRQRRLDNSLKLVTLFQSAIGSDDISGWWKIFKASSELAGAKYGFYVDSNRNQHPLSDLFSEGAPDNGAIERMAERFDLISYEALHKTIDVRLVYFELGQLMNTVHEWLTTIKTPAGRRTLLEGSYPHFARFFRKYHRKLDAIPYRTYSHIE